MVTGASTGIGLELARLCARDNFDLIVAADEPRIEEAADELSESGVSCEAVQCDLSSKEGVEQLLAAVERAGRPVDALLANAGRGLGHAFLDQNLDDALKVTHTNIDGTIALLHRVGRQMRARGAGRISDHRFDRGSDAGHISGSLQRHESVS